MKYLSVHYGERKNKRNIALKEHESVCISVIARVCNKRHLFQSCHFLLGGWLLSAMAGCP